MRYKILLTLWLLSDLALFTLSYTLAYFLRVGLIFSTDFPFDHFLTAVLCAAPVWLGAMAITRTFAVTRKQFTPRNAAYIAFSAIIGISVFTLSYYFLYLDFFSRLLLVEAFGISFVALLMWHVLYDGFARQILRMNPPSFPTLIVGVTRESKELIRSLNTKRNALKPVAILDGHGVSDKEIHGVPVRGKLNKLEEVLKEQKITHLIQASDLEQSMNLLSACRKLGITYLLLPSVLGIIERDERVESLEGRSVTIVSPKKSVLNWFFR